MQVKLLLVTLPFVLLIFVIHYLPLLGWSFAFVDYMPGTSVLKQPFTGFKHFQEIFAAGSDFPIVIRNTLVTGFLGIVVSPVPIIFAIMLSQVKSGRFSRTVQTVTSIPNFVSWILVYSIFFIFFAVDDGVVNRILLALHIVNEPTNMLGNNAIAWYFQVFVGLWKITGWNAIIYIAAMAGIDPELYSAADVDGANRIRKILHVTIPGITPTYIVMLLLAFANILSNNFDQFYVFQNPIVMDKLEVFDTYIYRMGILNSQFSFATAMGCFKSVVSLILLMFANTLSKALRGNSII